MNDIAYGNDEKALCRAKLINYLYCNGNNNHFPDMTELDKLPESTLWKNADEAWRGLKVAEKWSNLYSAYSIVCKLDSLRTMRSLEPNDTSQDFQPLSTHEEECMAAVEHNRWNVEKLLMGYRKAKSNEDKYNYPEYSKEFKNNKKKLYIHHDIRPFKDLDEVRQYDFEIVKFIPWILRKTESK